jgi:hypothetical protein
VHSNAFCTSLSKWHVGSLSLVCTNDGNEESLLGKWEKEEEIESRSEYNEKGTSSKRI